MNAMRTIAMRFYDSISTYEGVIEQHQLYINLYGSVWWGLRGKPISKKSRETILANVPSVILLIHSGKRDRWWGYVDDISFERPDENLIPSMYRDEAINCGTWFRINRFELAPKEVMMMSAVASSGNPLSLSSPRSRSPYFIIDYHGPRPSDGSSQE